MLWQLMQHGVLTMILLRLFMYPQSHLHLVVQFGTGKLEGPQAVDDFHIGPFSVFQQTFSMIERENGAIFAEVPFEGILGLAFPSMSANNVKPFFDTVISQSYLQNNQFAFYLSQDDPAANAIFWGGVDHQFHTGEIEYFPVVDPYYWAVQLHKFKIGNACLFGDGCGSQTSLLQSMFFEEDPVRKSVTKAILDTGTSFFTADDGVFEEVMARIPPAPCDSIDDTTHPPLTYTLRKANGELRDFVFTQEMYMASSDQSNGEQCSPSFMRIQVPEDHGPAMVLGEAFLRHYLAVFDRGKTGSDTEARLGLAPSVHSVNAKKRLRVLTHEQPSFDESRSTRYLQRKDSESALLDMQRVRVQQDGGLTRTRQTRRIRVEQHGK
eukprot:TRINITY_DN1468_c0_g2_i2.p1 TRINITY_DN1468_c0_g2~~TRINITY_DN1468_c0_g2_i2.p1  ORF type:complete len:380 (-),score=29.68 TRINITY_DN1468_c0_g2_i2:59-1198(-)